MSEMSRASVLNDFMKLTNVDENTAVHVLEACDWSLEKAYSLHFDDETSTFEERVTKNIEEDTKLINNEVDRSYDKYDSGFNIFRSRSPVKYHRNNGSKKLFNNFTPLLDLGFVGSFDSSKKYAEMRNKWLMVNIQDSEEFKSHIINRDIFYNEHVIEIVKENFILWQINKNSDDGNRFSTFYNIKTYPFVGIVDPRTGELMFLIKHPTDVLSFCEETVEFLSRHKDFSLDNERSSKKPRINIDNDEPIIIDDASISNQLEQCISLVENKNVALISRTKMEPISILVKDINQKKHELIVDPNISLKEFYNKCKHLDFNKETHDIFVTYPKLVLTNYPEDTTFGSLQIKNRTFLIIEEK